jgi:hypothetical protein
MTKFRRCSANQVQMEQLMVTTTPYSLKCFQQFCDCLKDKRLAGKLKAILCQYPTVCMELDENVWHQGYHETPCDVMVIPDSFSYPIVKDEVGQFTRLSNPSTKRRRRMAIDL